MANLDSRDYIAFSNNQVLNILYDEFDNIKSTYVRNAYSRLQDIVSDNIRTSANFMFSFIEDNVDLVLKGIFKNAYGKIEDELTSITNTTCARLDEAEDMEEVNHLVEGYKDVIEDAKTYKVDLDSFPYDYASTLNRFLMAKFDNVMSHQIEDAIDEVCRESKSYLERTVENIQQEIDNLIVRINVRQKDSLKHYVAEYKKNYVRNKTDNRFVEDGTGYHFIKDGIDITYKYERGNFNCYVDGTKVTDPSRIMEINRELQEIFPEAQTVTYAMVRSISDSLLDAKEQERARGTLSFEELLDMKASTHEARIPDWLRTGTGNESKEDSLDSITLDDYINQENKNIESVHTMLDKLEIKDEPARELTTEEKAELEEMTRALTIEDEPVRERTAEEKAELEEMTRALTIEDEPVRERTAEEKAEMAKLAESLEIKDEPVRERTPEEKAEMAKLTESLEIKDEPDEVQTREETKAEIAKLTQMLTITDEPVKDEDDLDYIQDRLAELAENPFVKEYNRLQEKLRAQYQEYQETVQEMVNEASKANLAPDVVLK